MLQLLVLAAVLVVVVIIVESDRSHRRKLNEICFWPSCPHLEADEGSELPSSLPLVVFFKNMLTCKGGGVGEEEKSGFGV